MEKSLIIQIEEFKRGLISQINASELPFPVRKYVLDEVSHLINDEYLRIRDEEFYKYQADMEKVNAEEEIENN